MEKENIEKSTENNSISNEKMDIQDIINEYGYSGKRTWFAILCLFCTILVQGIHFTYFGFYIIPLKRYFNLVSIETQIIASLFFVFVGIGSFLSGLFSEKIERPLLIRIVFGLIILFTYSMGLFRNVFVFTFSRSMIGLLMGILLPTQYAICVEYLPNHLRAVSLSLISISFGGGQLINSLLMQIYFPNLEEENIPKSIFFLEIPIFLCYLFNLIFINDSPRNLLKDINNNTNIELGFNILNEMKKEKGLNELTEAQKSSIINDLQININQNCSEDSYLCLFNRNNKRLSILIIIIHALNGLCSYGFLVAYALIIQRLNSDNKYVNEEVVRDIKILTIVMSFAPILAGALSELKFLGRIKTMILGNSLALFFCIVILYNQSLIHIWFPLFSVFLNVSITTETLYVAEAYNTLLRNKALGVANTACRVGAVLSQFLFLQLCDLSVYAPIYLFIVSNFILIISIVLLPFETFGANLDHNFKNNEEKDEFIPIEIRAETTR